MSDEGVFSRVRSFIFRNFVPIPKSPIKLATIGVYEPNFVEEQSPLISRDCLSYVFTFLDSSDLIRVQTVNKNWYRLANSNVYWGPICKRKFVDNEKIQNDTLQDDIFFPFHYKYLYYTTLREKRFGWVLGFRRHRNSALIEGYGKTLLGCGIICLPYYFVVTQIQFLHQIPSSRLQFLIAMFSASVCTQVFCEHMARGADSTQAKKYGTRVEILRLCTGFVTIGILAYVGLWTIVGAFNYGYNLIYS